jgi:hypothetical protein
MSTVRRLGLMALFLLLLGCHTLPNPNDPGRQKRIDDCLKQCGSGEPEPVQTAYPPAPSEQTDRRTPCERRCHGIP